MKVWLLRGIAAIAMMGLAVTASADTVIESFSCELEDEKTIEDVQAANSKWLAWVHKNVNAEITSAVLTAVVGEQDGFLFVDTYPSLSVWGETKEALDSEAGEEIEGVFEGLSECEENRLWKSEPTK